MKNNTIYDYDELKLKLLEFSKYKIIDKKIENIKFENIKKKLDNYKNESKMSKKYITVFIVSDNKVIYQYDERMDRLNFSFLNQYKNEKDNLKIIIYFFDTTTTKNNRKYREFSMINSNVKLKKNIKEYFNTFVKYILPLYGSLGIFFTIFTIFALSEYGIPTEKVMDFPIITISLISSIAFIVIIFSISTILISFVFIPALIFILTGYDTLYMYIIFQIIVMIAIILYFRIYKLHLLNEILPFIVKTSIGITTGLFAFISLVFLIIMSQSILSSLFPMNIFYDKSGYGLVIDQYVNRFSGYPKVIIDKEKKKYYVPVVDSNYYYVYDLNKSKNNYIESLRKEHITSLKNKKTKSRLISICKNDKTKKEFRKNFLVNNPYIKPPFLTEKISMKEKDIQLEPLKKLDVIITLEEVNNLCSNKVKKLVE